MQHTDLDKTDQKNLNILVNHKNFSNSLIEILDLILKKSNETTLNSSDKQTLKLYKSHEKLRSVCNDLKNGFSAEETDFDRGRIIKKIYKVLSQHINKIYPEPSIELFSLKNERNETITIIPGLDVAVVIKDFSESELNTLWAYLYVMYVSSVEMITAINDHKKNGPIWVLLPKLRDKVQTMGVITGDGKLFNPFVGLTQSTENYDVETMFTNIDNYTPPSDGETIENMFKFIGGDKLFSIDKLFEQLKNINPEEISNATKYIAQLMGGDNDSDISEVCNTLVSNIVTDLQSKPVVGFKDLFNIAESVSTKIMPTLGENKMKKTAEQFTNFLQNSEEKLQNMTDDKGKPISDIVNSLKIPLQLALQNRKK